MTTAFGLAFDLSTRGGTEALLGARMRLHLGHEGAYLAGFQHECNPLVAISMEQLWDLPRELVVSVDPCPSHSKSG